jgi:hypothetical protein
LELKQCTGIVHGHTPALCDGPMTRRLHVWNVEIMDRSRRIRRAIALASGKSVEAAANLALAPVRSSVRANHRRLLRR